LSRPSCLSCPSRSSGPFFPSSQLHGVRVTRRARSENPADDDSDEQHGGNEDEVTGGHRGLSFGVRRSSACISASTLPNRRQIDQRYTRSATHTNAYAAMRSGAAGSRSPGGNWLIGTNSP